MAIKLRTGQITLAQRTAALAMFNKLVAESFTVLPVTSMHFRAAAKFVDQHGLRPRAGDALHLATASEQGATVHTLDQRLATALRSAWPRSCWLNPGASSPVDPAYWPRRGFNGLYFGAPDTRHDTTRAKNRINPDGSTAGCPSLPMSRLRMD